MIFHTFPSLLFCSSSICNCELLSFLLFYNGSRHIHQTQENQHLDGWVWRGKQRMSPLTVQIPMNRGKGYLVMISRTSVLRGIKWIYSRAEIWIRIPMLKMKWTMIVAMQKKTKSRIQGAISLVLSLHPSSPKWVPLRVMMRSESMTGIVSQLPIVPSIKTKVISCLWIWKLVG